MNFENVFRTPLFYRTPPVAASGYHIFTSLYPVQISDFEHDLKCYRKYPLQSGTSVNFSQLKIKKAVPKITENRANFSVFVY